MSFSHSLRALNCGETYIQKGHSKTSVDAENATTASEPCDAEKIDTNANRISFELIV